MTIPHEATDWKWKLPLVKGNGEVVAYALVDEDDHGDLAPITWRRSGNGYPAASLGDGGQTALHRMLLGLGRGAKDVADHINHDILDNRRANLRIVTQAGNCQNQGAITTSSRFRGVSWHPAGSWHAFAAVDGKRNLLGSYLCETVAALAAEHFRHHHMPLAIPTDELAPFAEAIETGILACGRCASETPIRRARYWQVVDGVALCQPCNGYVTPKRGPKFQPPKACEVCARLTNHRKRGRCDTCYAFWRRNGFDRTPDRGASR